jgi:hypothetical protein
MVVASLIPFAIGMTVAATHWRIWFGRWISPPWRIPTMALGRFHPLATSSGNGRYLLTPAVPSGGFGSLQSTLRDVPPAPRSMPAQGGKCAYKDRLGKGPECVPKQSFHGEVAGQTLSYFLEKHGVRVRHSATNRSAS